MNHQIYLDNAATTRMAEEVKAAMEPYLTDKFGNASTIYREGDEAKRAMEQARELIAQTIGAKPTEIYFTSGGSESDNWAVKGIAGEYKREGRHIVTSAIEHHAVLNSCAYLESLGYAVEYVKPDGDGRIGAERVRGAMREDTTLVSVMYANNEVGTVQPIDRICQTVKSSGALFHTDAVQAYAQLPISVRQLPVDLLSASAHKFHGPKGVGFLYAREGVRLPSFIHGGGQERGKRAGTENIAGIVGMAEAARIAHTGMRTRIRKEMQLRNYLIERIMREIPDVKINGHRSDRLPGNVSVSFAGVESTSLLVLLDEDGICASGGSACNTGNERISYVLRAMDVPKEYAAGTVRLTLCGNTTREDVDSALASLKKNVALLRPVH